MSELLNTLSATLTHPFTAWFGGLLSGLWAGRFMERQTALSVALRAGRGLVSKQLEAGPMANAAWFPVDHRDLILTELLPIRRRQFRAAWERYEQQRKAQLRQTSGHHHLADPEPVRAALQGLYKAMRPVVF